MLYIERDEEGRIVDLHVSPNPKAGERRSITDPEIIDFLKENAGIDAWNQLLALSDTGVIRVIEDLIDVLIRKNLILFTDLPEQAQKRIADRKQVREKLSSQSLMVDDIL